MPADTPPKLREVLETDVLDRCGQQCHRADWCVPPAADNNNNNNNGGWGAANNNSAFPALLFLCSCFLFLVFLHASVLLLLGSWGFLSCSCICTAITMQRFSCPVACICPFILVQLWLLVYGMHLFYSCCAAVVFLYDCLHLSLCKRLWHLVL